MLTAAFMGSINLHISIVIKHNQHSWIQNIQNLTLTNIALLVPFEDYFIIGVIVIQASD